MGYANMRRLLTLLTAPTVLLVACDGPTDLGEDALLQTDRAEYLLAEDGTPFTTEIPYTFHNTTGRTVSLVNCNGYIAPVLQKWDDGEWVLGWAPVELGCLSPPVQIAPGEVFVDTLEVYGFGYGGNAHPQFATPNIEGTYRLYWNRARFDYEFPDGEGTVIPERYRVSNAFRLRVD